MAARRGALIALEGVDRAGKSTQGRRLVEALREAGHRADLLRFPDRTTEIGQLISSYLGREKNLEDHTIHLLFSANRWEHVPMMKEKLQQGITVVLDRYAFSGVAFTSAKGNFGLDWCKQPDVGLPKPDLILFLQLNPEAAAERGNFGQERYETSSFQEKVLQSFYCLMEDKSLNWKSLFSVLCFCCLGNRQWMLQRALKTCTEKSRPLQRKLCWRFRINLWENSGNETSYRSKRIRSKCKGHFLDLLPLDDCDMAAATA
ncbi:thymidylate kinase isoform X1 [Passer montanus]|uniref:thymidylate kinase isoform X1 n=1 Tax=Passer montanus TaxID=9160 RepID=UPI0019621D5F|nr:thymidylate kinase isoform X1 [Passer montanus]